MPDERARIEGLEALLERVRTTKGPDRELDARIWAEANGRDVVVHNSKTWSNALFGRYREPPYDECFLWSARGAWDGLPRLTASLDAALALVERSLPGWSWSVGCQGGRFRASLTETSPLRPTTFIAKDGATAGLVLVEALLLVYLHQTEQAHVAR